MYRLTNLLNYQSVFLLRIFALFWALLTLFRFIFFFVYNPGNLGFVPLVIAFLFGIRFDFSTMALLFAVPALFFWLPIRSYFYHAALHLVFLALLFFAAGVLIADITYYGFIGRHVTAELALFFQNKKDFLAMTLGEYWYVLFFLATVLFSLYYLYRKFVFLPAKKFETKYISWLWLTPVLLLHIGFAVFFIRGGWQSRSLNPAMAFQNDNAFLGSLALNGVYTGLTAWYKSDVIPSHQEYQESQAAQVQNLLYKKEQKKFAFKKPAYPFYQTHYSRKAKRKYNLVLVILESWSAADLKMFANDKPSATPFFDELSKKGLLFINCYATGQRSIASLPSILSSIPSVFGKIYTNSSYSSNRQTGLGTLFKQQGYRTYFAYSAKNTSMGFASYARIAGFDHVITKESFDSAKVQEDGSWGVYDHYTFQKIHELANEQETPFAAVVYTLHPHPPFHLPDDFQKPFGEDVPRADYFNALAYSDKTLRDFLALAKNSWYADNTIYVFVADHAFNQPQGTDRFHIPLLFYAPSLIQARTDDRPASQLDILPSLMDLFAFTTSFNAAGISLFNKQAHPFALWDMDNQMGYVKNDYVLWLTNKNPVALYNYRSDPSLQTNLLKNNMYNNVSNTMADDFYLYQSALAYSILHNAFVPPIK